MNAIVKNVRSVDAPHRWRWRDERGYVGFDPATPQDSSHNYGVDIGKAIALGKVFGARPDAQPERDDVVAAVADLVSGYIPDRILHASDSPQTLSPGALWVGSIRGPLRAALENLAPGMDYPAIEADAAKRVLDSRRARDSMREAAEREEAEARAEGRDGPRGRMSSGRKFLGDATKGSLSKFIADSAAATASTLRAMNEANRKFREERSGMTADARSTAPTAAITKDIARVASPSPQISMRDRIQGWNRANREFTARKREQERTILNPNGPRGT